MSKTIKSNISYSFVSNVLSVAISALVTFIVPRFIGVKSYGLFQLYIFYSSYIGFLHFGWADGFYLRHGGDYYEQLDKAKVSGQFWGLTMVELLLSLSGIIVGLTMVQGHEKSIVVALTASTIVVVLPRTLLQYVLQCTNRIKEYSLTVVAERIVYLLFVMLCIFLNSKAFYVYILADVIAKIVSLLMTCGYCKDSVLSRPDKLRSIVKEAEINISVGIKLMLSNIASMLIIGIVRYSIEAYWDVETFGKISLTLSVSNMVLVMLNAISLVLYPALRRISEERYSEIYVKMRTMLMPPVLGIMVVYYPLKFILSAWLPAYSESMSYMAILLPVCVFESKNSMLMVTFFKTMRKERILLFINSISVLLSIVLTYISTIVLGNLTITVLVIVVLVAFRNIISEVIISRALSINSTKEVIEELLLVGVFIISSWIIGGVKGLGIYLALYLVYLLVNRSEINEIYKMVILRNGKHPANK